MKIIYKYPLKLSEGHVLLLPRGAKALRVDLQNQKYYLWALVDLNKELVNTNVLCLGTGCPAPTDIDQFAYVNSIQEMGFVWHFFIEQQE